MDEIKGAQWCGEPLEDMTREQLLGVVAHLMRAVRAGQERERDVLEKWSSCINTRVRPLYP